MMKTLHWIALVCLPACTACVGSPGYEFPGLKGQVLDSMTKAPIAGATVSVTPFGGSGLRLTSASDPAGRFEVQRTTNHLGWYSGIPLTRAWTDAHIDVSADGYQPQRSALLDLTKRTLPDVPVYLTHR
jgi:hypothetical protein